MSEKNNTLADALGEQIPKEVQDAIDNLQTLKAFYTKSLAVLPEKEKQGFIDGDGSRNRSAYLIMALTGTENVIDNLKKHANDQEIKNICAGLNSFFKNTKTSNKLEAVDPELEKKISELKNRLTDLDAKDPGLISPHPLDHRSNRKEYYQIKPQLDQLEKEKLAALEKKRQETIGQKKEEKKPIKQEISDFVDNKLDLLEDKTREANKTLVKKEKYRIAEIAYAGAEDADEQASIHVLRQYNEFAQGILGLNKEDRDDRLTLLHDTVLAYKNIISPEFRENIKTQIAGEGNKILNEAPYFIISDKVIASLNGKFTPEKITILEVNFKDKKLKREDLIKSLKNLKFSADEAKLILDSAEKRTAFAGVRGFFQKMIKKGTELGVSGLSYLMGDPNSLLLKMGKAGAELTNEFLSPVQYNEALIKKVQDETLAEIDSVLALMKGNENIINALEDGIIDVKSTQSDYLKDEAKKAFLAKYEPFVKLTLQFNSNLIQKQSEFLTTAYTQSQGKENSMFPPDSEGAAKFMDPGQIAKLIKRAKDGFSSGEKVDQDALDKILNYIEENAGGRNYWRLFQVYSPFGIACPDEVDVKEVPGRTFNPKSVHIQSAYEQGWFKDHPVASALIQTSEFPAGYLLGKVGIWATKKLAKKLTLTGRIASSLSRYLPEMPKLLTWKTVLPLAIFGSLMLQPSGEEGESGVPVTLKQNEILDRIKQKASKYLPLEEKGEIDKAKLIEIPPFDELCAEEIKELRNEILFTALTTTEGVQKDLGYENLFWDHYTFYLRDALTDEKDPRNDYFRKQLQSTSTPNIINAYRKANKRLLFLGLDLIPYPGQ